ncbi:putative copper-exporting P-type ATPase V [Ensifer sp. M14]|nr:putative copper-exporting P-type ATPase V [Ensifer sp. M14]
MDVPISVGIMVAFILSLYDTFTGARHVYFDASVSLIFVLLAGRTLDQMMRGKVRSAIDDLQKMIPRGANLIHENGLFSYTPLEDVQPGMRLLIRSGDRVPVDAVVHEGGTEIDSSVVSGESRWKSVDVGATLSAGALNVGGPIVVVATKSADDSFLSEMARLVDAAESARTSYRRVADRAAALYSPVVHSIAAITLAGWLYVSGDLHQAVTTAIAVLIITCPCALGLAVPMVQVVATRRLFERGIMVRDGSALERVSHARTVLFDKTGTLTLGAPQLVNAQPIPAGALGIAASLARLSNHPIARAVAEVGTRQGLKPETFDSVDELHGLGIEGRRHGQIYRLGRASWATNHTDLSRDFVGTASVLTRDDEILAVFEFDDVVRPGASELVQSLTMGGTSLGIVSGDNERAVSRVANRLGIERFSAELLPADKVAAIRALQSSSDKVLMVGDGLNDAPALAAADVSIAPSTASDIGRNHADFIFLGDNLLAVREIVETAKRAKDLIRQNFGFAVAYNVVSIPFAIAGYVTPLAAAIAMSLSSVLVVCNSMRLARPVFRREQWSGHPAMIS